MDAASHLSRRSRLRSFAAGAGHVLQPDARSPNDSGEVLEGRYNPDLTYNTNIDDESVDTSTVKVTTTVKASTAATSQASTAKATSAVGAATTARAAAQAATVGTSKATTVTTAVTTSKAADYVTKSTVTTSSSSSITSSSAVTSTLATSTKVTSTTSSTPTSTTHSTSSIATTTSTSSSSHTIVTITSNNAVASTTSSISSAKTSSATAAASSGSTSKGTSTGSVVGGVFAAVAGLVILGALGGWLYRKYTSRSYSTKSPWSKLDDDITPFPPSFEKDGNSGGDIYGSTTSAPVIGSRRALALARANAFNNDGSLRPDSEMYERDNRAGLGAGGMTFGPYPSIAHPTDVYGLDPHGRPYNPQAGRTPMDHTLDAQYDDDPYQYSVDNTRQLVGVAPTLMPTAMPMGRPSAPSTDAEFALAEDFADIPEPYTPGQAYANGAPITPVYEGSNPEWPNEKQTSAAQAPIVNVEPVVTPPTTSVMRMPLPAFAPLSPLSSSFNLNRQSQPLAMYEDEQTQQKRMYGEVAETAGIDEPTTPNTAAPTANDSFTSTSSSFSAPVHPSLPTLTSMPRLPEVSLAPPQPYQHGQPLSPLNEVPTPLSTSTVPSNPFESLNMPVPPYRPDGLAPPYSAGSTGSVGSFPSPAYPPPSPGGMSVPGSVTDSPRRWSGAPRSGAAGRVVSTYDDEDAYGGI